MGIDDREDLAVPDKDTIAVDLIRWHFQVEPGLITVYRVINENEGDPAEPIKLIEVNAHPVSTGSLEAFGFAATKDVPYPTLIAEVTPDELDELRRSRRLSAGWDIERAECFSRPAA
jgi:hypothetical protein